MLRSWLAEMRDLVYPGFCPVCEVRLACNERDFCTDCHKHLTTDPHETCPRCSSSIGPFTDTSDGCPACRNERFAFQGCNRLGPYHGTLRDVIVRAKQRRAFAIAESLAILWADAMADRLRAVGATVIIAIPLYWTRRFRRGFNQSAILADELAKRLGVPHRTDLLVRRRATPSQQTQSSTQRRENIKGAFVARRDSILNDATVLLIDDVLTTGSTASEAARMLRNVGVASVVVAVVGHG